MTNEDGFPKKEWHLDKNVNVAVVLTLLTIAGGAWIKTDRQSTRSDERLVQIERRLEGIQNRYADLENEVTDQGLMIAAISAQIQGQNRDIARVISTVEGNSALLREFLDDQRSRERGPR